MWDFAKLIEAKENIERLNENFAVIQQEIHELDGILSEYDAWENAGTVCWRMISGSYTKKSAA